MKRTIWILAIGYVMLSSACSFRDLTSREVCQKAKNSIVMVRTRKGSGTGFYITERGILTNAHVVKGEDLEPFGITVETADGAVYPAIIMKYSDNPDLAWILTIPSNCWTDPPEKWLWPSAGKPLEIDRTYSPEQGEEVIAIGNPMGLRGTATYGKVSAIRSAKGVVYIQTDAPISPGNSGGPLFNMKGKVIGVTTFKYHPFSGAEGLGFAISIPSINYFLAAPQDMLPIIREKTQRGKRSSRATYGQRPTRSQRRPIRRR